MRQLKSHLYNKINSRLTVAKKHFWFFYVIALQGVRNLKEVAEFLPSLKTPNFLNMHFLDI